MKKLVLVSVMVFGLSYGMDKEDQKTDQRALLLSRANETLNTSNDKLQWRCPDCGTNGGPVVDQDKPLRCRRCRKVFKSIDIRGQIKNAAQAAIMRIVPDESK